MDGQLQELSTTGELAGWAAQRGNTMLDQARSTAREVRDRTRAAAVIARARAQDLARRGRDRAASAGEVLYQEGTRAGEYVARSVNEYPLSALLIAGVIGYGIGYLIHHR